IVPTDQPTELDGDVCRGLPGTWRYDSPPRLSRISSQAVSGRLRWKPDVPTPTSSHPSAPSELSSASDALRYSHVGGRISSAAGTSPRLILAMRWFIGFTTTKKMTAAIMTNVIRAVTKAPQR